MMRKAKPSRRKVKATKPRTIAELRKTNKAAYEEFLRQNRKYGVTFKHYMSTTWSPHSFSLTVKNRR